MRLPRPDWQSVLVILAAAVVLPFAGYVAVRTPTPPPASGSDASPAGAADLSTPSDSPSVAPAAGAAKTVLFLGDAYVNGGPYANTLQSMGYLAARELGWTPLVTTTGDAGFAATGADGTPPYPGQVRDGALPADAAPDLVVLEGGLNDRDRDPAMVRGNAKRLVKRVATAYPDATIVVVGPVDTDGVVDDTRPVTAALAAAARSQQATFVNATGWLRGKYDLIGADGQHPTRAGQRVLAQRLATALEKATTPAG